MLYEDKFQQILSNDEVIIKTYKPNKKRATFLRVIFTIIPFTIFALIPIIFGVFQLINPFLKDGETEELCPPSDGIPLLIVGGVILFIMICVIIGTLVRYKNTIYALTNKRVLFRGGFIGVDFKTLDYGMIGGITVDVGLVDKLIKTNTGTIVFGSSAAPMLAVGRGGSQSYPFAFLDIEKPYDVYKEVKTIIDENTASK